MAEGRCDAVYLQPDTLAGSGAMCELPAGHPGDHINETETPWFLRWREGWAIRGERL